MAEDINLPNLVSHLQVNLGNTSGIIADATRQGSSVGAAIGESMQRTLRAAVDDIPEVQLDANSSDLDRDLDRVRRELAEIADQRIGVDVSIEDALSRLADLEPHLERLQRSHPSINVTAAVGGALADLADLRDAAQAADDEDVDIDVDVDDEDISDLDGRLTGVLRTLGSLSGRIAVPFAMGSAAAGTMLPILAGVVSALGQIAPAAAVGTQGLLAMQLASATLKLGMQGVSDAVSAALDPSKAEEFEEALKKLSPEARAFVMEIREAAPELRKLQQEVQNRLFKDLDETLQGLSKTTLPVLRRGLTDTADALNKMARGVGDSVGELGKDGTLGTAVNGATEGLENLNRVPGQIVAGLLTIAAAAAPMFDRLTETIAEKSAEIAKRIDESYKSGSLEKRIEGAVSLLKQLGRIAGDLAGVFKNVMLAADADGGGLLRTLESITQSLQDATGTDEFQAGLKALFDVMGEVAEQIGPMLVTSLGIIGDLLAVLGPPVESLIETLGEGLNGILKESEPVWKALGEALGALGPVLEPFIALAAQLITDILPILTPLFDFLREIFERLAPVAEQLATNIGAHLTPILDKLPGILDRILPLFLEWVDQVLPVLSDLLVEMEPYLREASEAIADMLVELMPLVEEFIRFQVQLSEDLMPIIRPLAELLGGVFLGALTGLATIIRGHVIPVIRTIAAMLRGDFSEAGRQAGRATTGLRDMVSGAWTTIRERTVDAISRVAEAVARKAREMKNGFVEAMGRLVREGVAALRDLPGRARSMLSGLGSVLVSVGGDLIDGLLSGIRSKIPSLEGLLRSITSKIPDWKGPSVKDRRLLTPAGQQLIQGLMRGISQTVPQLELLLSRVTRLIETALRGTRSRGKSAALWGLEQDTRAMVRLAEQRDKIAARLKTAQERLTALVKERADYLAGFTEKALGEADIVGNNRVVASVSAITIGLQQAVKRTKDFDANFAKLQKLGLRKDLLQQISDAGVAAGSATAEALARATPEQIAQINKLQGQLTSVTKKTATSVADGLYGAGIRTARGVVDGLRRQQTAIQRELKRIADGLAAAIRAALSGRALPAPRMAGATVAGRDTARDEARLEQSARGRAQAGHTFNLYQTSASPEGILSALSWHGLVGGA
jgi:phage-related protein/polyhydroxyalkanoate synthesis regulator phasin